MVDTQYGDEEQMKDQESVGRKPDPATVPSGPLNTSEIESLAAGRELDAAIAERVMGWSLVANSGAAGGRYWQGHGGSFGDMSEYDLTPFSTDIAAAMEAVEKMQSRNYGWNFSNHGHGWTVEIFPLPDTGYDGLKTVDDVLAVAICYAALQATATASAHQP